MATTSRPEESETIRRPALVRLTDDHRELIDRLHRGFDSRQAVLNWHQELAVRTLGEVPQQWFLEVARQFRVPPDGSQRTLLAALLADTDLDDDSAARFRGRIATNIIHPAFHAAFGALRREVTEYVGEGEDTDHDPAKQRYIAMRPVLDDLDRWQRDALDACLDGLADERAIKNWGEQLELATHGEIDGDAVPRWTAEGSTFALLTDRSPGARTNRELFAAYHLLPLFNQGAADLFGGAGEEPATSGWSPMEPIQG